MADIVSAVGRIVPDTPAEKRLDPARNPAAIRKKTGLASMGSGQIASPLTETSRGYYASRDAVSSDGVFTFSYSPIESIVYSDANGNPVVFDFTDPP